MWEAAFWDEEGMKNVLGVWEWGEWEERENGAATELGVVLD